MRRKIAVGDLGEFWYGDYKEPFIQLEGAVPGYPQGVLLTDDAGMVLCAYCGKTFDNLGVHVKSHGLTARAYKQETGLLLKSALISERVRMDRVASGLRSLARGNSAILADPAGMSAKGAAKSAETRRGRPRSQVPERQNLTGRCFAQVLAIARSVMSHDGKVTARGMRSCGVSDKTVYAHFGSHTRLGALVGDLARGTGNQWSKEQLLTGLSSLASKLGRTPAASDLRRYGLPTQNVYRKHFGSYVAACVAAGLPANLPRALGPDEKARILSAFAAGKSPDAIAADFGVKRRRVLYVLDSFGIPTMWSMTREQKATLRVHAANIVADLAA